MSDLMTRIYLVRHGSTAWNEVPRFRGSADIPLSETGQAQAAALSRYFARLPLAAVYASPLLRARATAESITALHGLPVQLRDGLRSVNYGDWEGKTEEEVARMEPEAYHQYLEYIERFRFPQGETLNDLRDRAYAVLEEGVADNPGREIVLVTHQVVTRVLLCAVLGIGNEWYWRFGQDPGCLNLVEREGHFSRLQWMNLTPSEG